MGRLGRFRSRLDKSITQVLARLANQSQAEEEFDARARAWDGEVEKPRPKTDQATVDFLLGALKDQLERSNAAVAAMDNKAALVVPAVGVVATLVGSDIVPDLASRPVALAALVLASLCGAASIALAIRVLAPWSTRSVGPDPLRLVRGAGDSVLAAKLGVLNSLGFAVQTAVETVMEKGLYLTWSMRMGALGVIALVVFMAFGGRK